jgi:hypothetical protein
MRTEKPASTRAYVQGLLARRPDIELSFAQHRGTGTVHVLIPDDPDLDPTFEPIRSADDFDFIGWAIGEHPALCGWTARVHLGGFEGGDQLIDTFADRLLCGRCHDSLGPHASRAFEHPTPEGHGDDGDAPLQLLPPPHAELARLAEGVEPDHAERKAAPGAGRRRR